MSTKWGMFEMDNVMDSYGPPPPYRARGEEENYINTLIIEISLLFNLLPIIKVKFLC